MTEAALALRLLVVDDAFLPNLEAIPVFKAPKKLYTVEVGASEGRIKLDLLWRELLHYFGKPIIKSAKHQHVFRRLWFLLWLESYDNLLESREEVVIFLNRRLFDSKVFVIRCFEHFLELLKIRLFSAVARFSHWFILIRYLLFLLVVLGLVDLRS